jgi:hypothetical protein
MSYKINNTSGELLVELVDGKKDADTTDLVLVGRNFTGYGEDLNENFVKLLENFASTSAPNNPTRGQIWYDTSEGRLKVYNGEIFKGTDTTVYASTEPDLIAGDIWIDSSKKQMYFSDGVSNFLVGPNYSRLQGQTGTDAIDLKDNFGATKTVARMMVAGRPVAIISREEFIAANIDENIQYLDGENFTFSLTIKQGFNLNTDTTVFNWNGTADTAKNLVDSSNNPFSPSDFIQVTPTIANDTPQITNHFFQVRNDRGIVIGDSNDLKISIDANDELLFRAQRNNQNMRIQTSDGSNAVDVFTIDATTNRLGIYNDTPNVPPNDGNGDPLSQVDVYIGKPTDRKSVRITGDLLVDGTQTSLDTTTLRVEDINIQLGITEDSTLLDDSAVDGGGVILNASGQEKSLLWDLSSNSWTSNVGFNIESGFAYKIGGSNVLTTTELSSSVTLASGLVELGTLQYLNVDNFSFNGGTMTVSSNLITNINGDLQLDIDPANSTTKILGLSDPTDDNDAANKKYTDERIEFAPVYLSLDTTGLNDTQIALVLNDLVPQTSRRVGVNARVHCTQYTGSIEYNGTDGLSKSTVNVDSNGVQNQSVIQDVSFNNVTESVTFSVIRTLKRFEINSVQEWEWQEDLISSV